MGLDFVGFFEGLIRCRRKVLHGCRQQLAASLFVATASFVVLSTVLLILLRLLSTLVSLAGQATLGRLICRFSFPKG